MNRSPKVCLSSDHGTDRVVQLFANILQKRRTQLMGVGGSFAAIMLYRTYMDIQPKKQDPALSNAAATDTGEGGGGASRPPPSIPSFPPPSTLIPSPFIAPQGIQHSTTSGISNSGSSSCGSSKLPVSGRMARFIGLPLLGAAAALWANHQHHPTSLQNIQWGRLPIQTEPIMQQLSLFRAQISSAVRQLQRTLLAQCNDGVTRGKCALHQLQLRGEQQLGKMGKITESL
jgi:hypothetical protein